MEQFDPQPVLACFAPLTLGATAEFLGQAGGLSGALFWRVGSPLGMLCLRRWPGEHPDRERLQFIHAVLSFAARNGVGFLPVPLASAIGETIVEHADFLWELAPWLPGSSDYETRPTKGRLEAAMVALARLHVAVSAFPLRGATRGVAPGIADRIEQMRAMADPLGSELTRAAATDEWPELADRVRRVLVTSPACLPRVWRQLQEAAGLEVSLAPCLRDIWHENVLFTGQRVTGLVDFGAMRVDNVSTDVARLLGSMAADDLERWRAGLAAYAAVRPLSADEATLVAAYDVSSVLLGCRNWVRWLCIERRTFDDRAHVLRRLDHLIGRLDRLAQLDEPAAASLAVQALQRPDAG